MGKVFQRGKKWYIDYTAGTQRVRQSIGGTNVLTKKDAQEILAQREREARLTAAGIAQRDCEIVKLRKTYEAFAQQTLRPNSFLSVRSCLRAILTQLAPTKVSDLTADKIINYRRVRLAQNVQKRARRVSPRTVNMEVGALSTMLNFGVKQGILTKNPIKGLPPLKNERPYKNRRPLALEEVHAILNASTDHYRPIWRALLTTGMRISELANLRFRDIDWDTREFIVRGHSAKNHHERRIPIEDATVWSDLIERRKTAPQRQPGKGATPEITAKIKLRFSRDHVYVTAANTILGNNVTERFAETCRRAGIEVGGLEEGQGNAIDLHALRGTFATHAAANGADIAALGEVTGHKDISVLLNHYTKTLAQTKRKAVASLPWVSGSPEPPNNVVAIDKRHNGGTASKIATQLDSKSRVG